MLCLGSIGVNHAISELYYKGTILQWNYRKMTIPSWSFSYNSVLCKIHGKKMGVSTLSILHSVIQIFVITVCYIIRGCNVIGLYFIMSY